MTTAAFGTLAQVAVTFRDLPKAVAWYRDVLQLPLMFETGGMAFFAMGPVRLMMTAPEDPEFDHPASVLYFKVENIDATHAELAACGVAFDGAPHLIGKMGPTEIWMAFFRDCEEHMLAITEERSLPQMAADGRPAPAGTTIDGLIYALLTVGTFGWLWPHW